MEELKPPARFARSRRRERGDGTPDSSASLRAPRLCGEDLFFLNRAEVPDDSAGVDVDDVFGDVGAVVCDSFEIFGDHDVAELCVGFLAVGFHQADHVLNDLVIECVDDVVALEDVAGESFIAEIKGLNRVAKRCENRVGHQLEICRGLVIGKLREGHYALGDVDGAIGDSFEIRIYFDDRGNGAKIDGCRLLKRQKIDSTFFDADFLLIYSLIERDRFLREFAVDGEDGFASLLNKLDDKRRHPCHLRAQAFEKIVEMM
jgi:hypothetical protein